MISIIFFLAFSAVVIGAVILLWDRRELGAPARLDQYERFLDRDPDRFRHLARIMGPDDREFLRSIEGAGKFVKQLERDRRRVLRLTLRDLQQEFRALVAVGVMLAASSTARRDSFGVKLMWNSLCFHTVCLVLRGLSYIPAWEIPGRNAKWATAQVRMLRSLTRELLAALTNEDMDQLRNQILTP